MISVLVIVFAAVMALDASTTKEGLDRGLREANPVLRWAMKIMGEAGPWVTFTMFGLIALMCVMGLYGWSPWAGYALAGACIVWRGLVVCHNFRVLAGKK